MKQRTVVYLGHDAEMEPPTYALVTLQIPSLEFTRHYQSFFYFHRPSAESIHGKREVKVRAYLPNRMP